MVRLRAISFLLDERNKKMTTRAKYVSLLIIAVAGFFIGARIYEDHEIDENTPTILILEEADTSGNDQNNSKEVTLNMLEATKEVTQDILSGSKEIGSDLKEGLQIEETTPSK